ncbi:MAG TPA: RNA methyltransferase [Leptospiraceae bacterium]|nr:RNA methyltransferase [Leptospiraceae bacterium]HNI28765.1 RNA methyltransferase [Leptospiraceae bacterium]HNI98199.1 RNA methyltransferase [Leptospiraceae bacterium]
MLKLKEISSGFSDWDLYRNHSDSLAELRGLFLADGEKTVLRLLESGLKIKEIICREKYLTEEFLKKTETHPEIENVWKASSAELKTVRGYDLHQGIMALAYVPALNIFPESGSVLVCNGITEANNIGSLLRSCPAFGVNAVILDSLSCHPYIRRSVRVSMGNIFGLNIFRTDDLKTVLLRMKMNGYSLFGTSLSEGSEDFRRTEFPEKSALILGNEDSGISEEIETVCDRIIKIPMKNGVDSLNVAVSGAVFLSRMMR